MSMYPELDSQLYVVLKPEERSHLIFVSVELTMHDRTDNDEL